MKIVNLMGLSALLSLSAVACVASSEEPSTSGSHEQPIIGLPSPTPLPPAPAPAPAACTPLPKANNGGGAIGMANPASVYCIDLGYKLEGELCVFSDNTSCEEWAFFGGKCGQAHSFCNLHGGSLASKTEDMGGWTADYALCTLPTGKSCQEDTFAHNCSCE